MKVDLYMSLIIMDKWANFA